MRLTRRAALVGASGGVVLGRAALAADGTTRAQPLPMQAVRLTASRFLDATTVNRDYLFRLEPDRLLHNFRAQAGLQPKAAVYGGWESDTIAGHTLGHYLSALSLLHAQTGDDEAVARIASIVSELAACQGVDGFLCGFTRRRDGRIEPGRAAFDEIAAGRIHSTGFDLNGCWSPLYNWHKLMAGLLDAHALCGNQGALAVCTGLARYLGSVFDRLDESQMQDVLACEYGGLNESFAELSVRDGDRRWLAIAERLYDRRTLDPLAAGRDDLANLHANTQIPKIIGLARLHEIDGRADHARAARIFWTAVVEHHSFVIGGNGDREYFTAADSAGDHVTEQTCETCASYNMLKLTRQIHAQDPKAAQFDFYERTQLNHILAQQNPRTGMFAYMTPLLAGATRDYSTPFDDFWCCVGTGMESHAKHGDSIWWRTRADTLLLNLFIPSVLDWQGRRIAIETAYPEDGTVALHVERAAGLRTLRVRIPAWSTRTGARLNGAVLDAAPDADGYLTLHRVFADGDRLVLGFDMRLRLERPAGSPGLVSVLRGPVVLAADLGPADRPWTGTVPALVAADPLASLRRTPDGVRSQGSGRPGDLLLVAFAQAHDRRTAPYLPVFTEDEWAQEQVRFRQRETEARALAARSTDQLHPGEMQSEHDHGLESALSYPLVYRGRNGRDARSGGFFSFRLRTRPVPLELRVTYWGEERHHDFRILVQGSEIATERLDGSHPGRFFDRSYPVPPSLSAGRATIEVRFEPLPDSSAGPVFGVACLTASAPGATAL